MSPALARALEIVNNGDMCSEDRIVLIKAMQEKDGQETSAMEAALRKTKSRRDTMIRCSAELSKNIQNMKVEDEKTNKMIERARENATREYSELVEQANQLSIATATILSEIDSVTETKQKVEKQRLYYEDDCDMLKRQCDTVKKQCVNHGKILSDKRAQLTDLCKKVYRSEEEIARLEGTVADHSQRRFFLEAQATRETDRNSTIISKIASVKQERKVLNTRLWESITELRLHRLRVLAFEKKCADHVTYDFDAAMYDDCC
jgi:chromosome segregation ATPase